MVGIKLLGAFPKNSSHTLGVKGFSLPSQWISDLKPQIINWGIWVEQASTTALRQTNEPRTKKARLINIGTSARKFQVLLPFEPFSHQLVFGEIIVYLMFSLSCFIDVSTYRFISWSIYVLVSLFMQGFNCWLYSFLVYSFIDSFLPSFLPYPLESLICFFNSPGTRRLTEFPEAAVGENPVFVDHLKKPPENCGFDNFLTKTKLHEMGRNL